VDDLAFASATKVAELVRNREVSATEVLDEVLRQIEQHNPRLNAVVTLDEAGARARAREADRMIGHGEVIGPLHGVPVVLKDALETAGMRTTAGHLPLADYVPTADAPVVARLRAAGAVILGMTNMPELGGGGQSMNAIFGRTNNPWDLERTPGGSTGGGAAAVAAGMAPVAIGSDNGGSVRIPAHFSGICSIKPTQHRVPTTGHIPEVPGKPRGMRNFNVIGPLAREVADLDLVLRIIAGPDGRQWEVPPVPLAPMPQRDIASLRIGWIDGWQGLVVSSDIRATIRELAATLDRAGAAVDAVDPTLIDIMGTMRTANDLFMAELAPSRDIPAADPVPSIVDYTRLLEERDTLAQVFEHLLTEYDAFLLPVTASPAFRHVPHEAPIPIDGQDVDYWLAVTGHTFPFNLSGHPAVVIPGGQSAAGLPIGVQLVGPRWGEAGLLGVAAAISELIGPWRRPPGY